MDFWTIFRATGLDLAGPAASVGKRPVQSPYGHGWGYSGYFHFFPNTERGIPGNKQVHKLPKFMQTLNDSMYRDLEKVAKQRGITVQELIRAVILPDWLSKEEHGKKH